MFDQVKRFADMQRKLKDVKDKLGRTTVQVKSADGLVTLTMNGSQQLQSLDLAGDLASLKKEELEKALKDALGRALVRCQEVAATTVREITGISLPQQNGQ